MSEPESSSPQPSTTLSPPHPTPSTPLPLPLSDLQNISSSLSTFQTSFNSLQLHLNSLKSLLDSLISNPPSQNPQIPIIPPSKPIADTPSKGIIGKNSTEPNQDPPTNKTTDELKSCCERMSFKGLKRHIYMNLKNIVELRVQVPKALKYARNPAKLVLECCGKFYLQGLKAFMAGDLVTGREASVLVLEFFILMEGGEEGLGVDEDVKEEADKAVKLWRKRMISEGGIMRACEIDARGLLLLMGGFGVPLTFKNEDLRDLMRVSNVREMAGTLRKSRVLMEKVPDIIELMIKNKLEVDAIDVAYSFGLEERFNIQAILTSLLQQIKEPSKKGKKSSASPAENDANREQLAVLKSFVKCMEGHKIDSTKIISKQQIQKKISSLEKDVFEYDKKSISDYDKEIKANKIKKRKAEEAEAEAGRRSKFWEGNHSHYTLQGGQQQQKVGHHSQRSILDPGMAGHINGYSASPSMLHGQVPGTGYASAGAYGGMTVDHSGHVINHGVQSHAYHADPTLTKRVITRSYAAQPSSSSLSRLYRPAASSLEGYVMLPSGSSIDVPHATTDLYQFADTVVDNEYHPPIVPSNHRSYQY